jgi:hypothetical protein
MRQIKPQLLLLFPILISVISMFYQFREMPPPYPWADEAGVGYEANLTLASGPRMIDPSPIGAVHDPHYVVTVVTVFLAAAVFKFLGSSLTTLRVISGVMGIISVGAVYFLATEVFWEEMGARARYIGLASSGLMAVSVWLMGVSRIGWAPPAALMLGTIFLCFFWKAVNTQNPGDYALAGLLLALAQYGHITARFLPFALGAFLALNLLWNLIRHQVQDSLICRDWRGWLIMGSVALVGILPIIQYYVRFPEDLSRRARLVSPALSSTLDLREQVGTTFHSLISKMQILGFDPTLLFSQNVDTLLSPVVVILFLGGMSLLLFRLPRKHAQFLLVGWIIMSAPAWLTSSADVPFLKLYDYARRGILAAPFTFVVAGMFLVKLAFLLPKWTMKTLTTPFLAIRQRLVPRQGDFDKSDIGFMGEPSSYHIPRDGILVGVVSVAIIIVLTGWYNYHVYFVKWPTNSYIEQAFSPQFIPTVKKLQEISEPQALFLFPINLYKDTTQRPDLYTIGFLLRGDAPFAVMTNDEASLGGTLTEVTQGQHMVYLLQSSDEDDPKHAIYWWLSAFGQLQPTSPEVPGYQVDAFVLDSKGEDFTDLPEPVDEDIPFGPTMQLSSHRYGSNLTSGGFTSQQVESGDNLLIDLSWKLLADNAPDYNVTVILRNASEQTVTQADSPLVNAAGLTSARWQAGTTEHVYLSLPMPVGLPAGQYWLDVALYDAPTLRRENPLLSRGDLSYRLGAVTVLPPTGVLPSVDVLEPGVRTSIQITPSLQMAGVSLQTEKPLPVGGLLQGVIYWQALATMSDDIVADYVIVTQDGSVIPLAQSVLLGGNAYPTHLWRASEIVADYLSLRIPAKAPGTVYRFGVRLTGGNRETLAELPLGELTINSWDRQFELPADVSPLMSQLGEAIKLVGARLPKTGSPGEALPIYLYWQTEQGTTSDYIAFVHFLDETGKLAFQNDSVPGQGTCPVPGWLVGEVVEDYHNVAIPTDVAPGMYRVAAGLYDANSGKRLSLLNPSDGAEQGDAVYLGYIEIQ